MITAKFHGQLGNNLFQLATLLSLKEQGRNIFLLDSVHRGNIEQINSFFIHPKKLEFKDMFEYQFNFLDEQVFQDFYLDKFKLYNHPDLSHNGHFGFNQVVVEDFTIINGYFQSEKYFQNISEKIKNVYFAPSVEIKQKLNQYNFTNSLSIHYRRGGDRHIGNMQQYFKDLDFEYYKNNINYICNKKTINTLFVFSDDIPWCKQNMYNLLPDHYNFNIIYVENNKNYVDLFLMSRCENNIIGNSTFSWWAAWLNTNQEKVVIAPKNNWFGPSLSHLYLGDLFPNNWVLK
jgi:hypothetical protein